MAKDMSEGNNCDRCCFCSMNCPKNQKSDRGKKEDNGWLWALFFGGALTIALSGCVPQANTSNLETLDSSTPTQSLVK